MQFRKKKGSALPPISTASLPDIVFMLLFFFMVTTTMRETELKIRVKVPEATEIKKLEKKSLVSYINVGIPLPQYRGIYGTEPRMQLNDKLSDINDISGYIESERKKHDENEVPLLTTSLKVDEEAKMGIVTDIKQELRKVQALKINYSTRKALKRE
jgi:biopolymer transport protein ExbD